MQGKVGTWVNSQWKYQATLGQFSVAINTLLANLNTTVREDTGKLHWHIHIVERNGEMGLWLPQLNATVDLSPYKIQALEVETEH